MSEHSVANVCACGRLHRPQERKPRRRPRPRDHAGMVAEVYEAKSAGKAEQTGQFGEWVVHYAGNCISPVTIRRNSDKGALFVDYAVRCRRCRPCLLARMHYWAQLAARHVRHSDNEGPDGERTWFGTLTLGPVEQSLALDMAIEKYMARAEGSGVPAWFTEPECDERFRLVREVLVGDVQRYWKRLRKAGHRFKYMLTFERHKSGLPHMHFLLHEQGVRINAAPLQDQWHAGHTHVALVGGPAARKRGITDARRAGYYCAKYLSKSSQARQLVSLGYKNPPSPSGIGGFNVQKPP